MSREDYQRLDSRVLRAGFIVVILFALSLATSMYYELDRQTVMITGAVMLILATNVLLLYRSQMISRHSNNLCFDGGRCYTMTKNWDTCDWSPARLHYRGETLTFFSAGEVVNPSTDIFAFQVIDGRDWQAIKAWSELQTTTNGKWLSLNEAY